PGADQEVQLREDERREEEGPGIGLERGPRRLVVALIRIECGQEPARVDDDHGHPALCGRAVRSRTQTAPRRPARPGPDRRCGTAAPWAADAPAPAPGERWPAGSAPPLT